MFRIGGNQKIKNKKVKLAKLYFSPKSKQWMRMVRYQQYNKRLFNYFYFIF